MNVAGDHVLLLEQLLFDQATGAARADRLVAFCKSWVGTLTSGLIIPVTLSILLLALLILAYRPKVRRGSFWLPAFGLVGGTPTLYLHSRPASLFGLFLRSRRKRRLHS